LHLEKGKLVLDTNTTVAKPVHAEPVTAFRH